MKLSDFSPNFVIVMGGAGSGKNYYVENHPKYSKYLLVDVDQFKIGMDLSAAIRMVIPMLIEAFKTGNDVVHTGTMPNINTAIKKINLAKDAGYVVTLILVDTDPKQAIANVASRVGKGGHHVPDEVVVSANLKSKENFRQLQKYADYSNIVLV